MKLNITKYSLPLAVVIVLLLSRCGGERVNEIALTIAPSDSVVMFAKEIISTRYNERDMAISPEGDHLLYTVQDAKTGYAMIVECNRIGDRWSEPVVTSFSGQYSDLEPFFSPDGSRLYFASNRPKRKDAKVADYDLWYVDKATGGWGTPKHLGDVVNSDKDEFYPSIAANGNLYFTGSLGTGPGAEDIYVSRLENGAFTTPVALDTAVNSATYDFNAFISPDESVIIFSSYGRPDDVGGGDLYISRKDDSGRWTKASNLGEINSASLDYCPFVTADKKVFFFTSNRGQKDSLYHHLSLPEFKSLLDGVLNGNGNIYSVGYDVVLRHTRPQ